MRTSTSQARLKKRTRTEQGFTLVELLLTMLVSSLIMIGVYAAFEMQHRTHNAQEQNVDMQQNIRAAMTLLSSDIRMAGFDPSGKKFKQSEPVITRAELGRITFVTVDEDEDETNPDKKFKKKYVSYRLGFSYDQNNDGVVEITPGEFKDEDDDEFGLRMYSPTLIRCERFERACEDANERADNWQAVARGVEAVEFVYLTGDDMKPELWREDEATDVKKKNIHAVTISLLMRADAADQRIVVPIGTLQPASVQVYERKGVRAGTWSTVIQQKIKKDDQSKKDDKGWERERQHRRRLLYTTVQMRNTNLVKP